MNDFLTNLLNRHIGLGEKALPRTQGRFEPDANAVLTSLPQYAQEVFQHPTSAVVSPANVPARDNMDDPNFAKQPGIKQPIKMIRSAKATEQKTTRETQYNSSPESTRQPISKEPGFINMKNIIEGIRVKPGRPLKGLVQQDNNVAGLRQPVSLSKSPDLAVVLPKSGPGIKKSLPGTTALHNMDNASHGLLGAPPRLSHQQSNIDKGLFKKNKKAETEPVIKVNIGRIEVRAVTNKAPVPPRRKASPKPKLSLTEYLTQRDGGQQ